MTNKKYQDFVIKRPNDCDGINAELCQTSTEREEEYIDPSIVGYSAELWDVVRQAHNARGKTCSGKDFFGDSSGFDVTNYEENV